ncbi:NADH-quinone oxidoreductase subunit J [Peptococcus simiae]|uniref:NADH-quinone oxidoreductase subunit J n=1 Tax=Peptococcus simiae TaxID=1643805 RepID=A0ABW9H2X5_9FIRM
MTSTISPALFYFFAVILVASALGMAVSRNLFRTALLMLVTFASVAGIYASMHEKFLAVAQLLVYVGAITILIIFGIMLTKSYGIRTLTNPFAKTAVGGGVVAAALCFVVSMCIRILPALPAGTIAVPSIYRIGISLFGVHILATELAAVLLLVAMIGALMITEKGDDAK